MKEKVSQTGLPREIPLSVLLGLSDPKGVGWGRIRALQFEGMQQHGLFKLVGTIVCGIVILQMGIGLVNPIMLTGWFATLCAIYIYSHIHLKKQSVWKRKTLDRKDTIFVYANSP